MKRTASGPNFAPPPQRTKLPLPQSALSVVHCVAKVSAVWAVASTRWPSPDAARSVSATMQPTAASAPAWA